MGTAHCYGREYGVRERVLQVSSCTSVKEELVVLRFFQSFCACLILVLVHCQSLAWGSAVPPMIVDWGWTSTVGWGSSCRPPQWVLPSWRCGCPGTGCYLRDEASSSTQSAPISETEDQILQIQNIKQTLHINFWFQRVIFQWTQRHGVYLTTVIFSTAL